MSKINHPKHYQYIDRNGDPIEAIEIIERMLTEEQFKGFLYGNAIKYTLRAGFKEIDTYVEDWNKSQWYLDRLNELFFPLDTEELKNKLHELYGPLPLQDEV